ncbi:MAG TPA: acetyltransferase [Noviherbaspirillum sp.]|jgi:UDP-perosamine 4-acetyltransferase|uniref:acetyltransferase n=1 Tax=Noviherbaspirillum sp. TaxID=1926288 RepID=UPI002F94ACEF
MNGSPDIASMPLVLLGAGGHARVLLALARAAGMPLYGVCDPGLAAQSVKQWDGLQVLGGDDALDRLDPARTGLINGVGQLVGAQGRRKLYDACRAKGFGFPVLVHPAAWVAPNAELAQGVQVMAGAVVQPGSRIGENSVVNTRAGIDHDCVIGAHVHIAPGAILCGGVGVGDRAFVGAGATVIQGLQVGEDAVLAAGAVLVRNLDAGSRYVGPRENRTD